MEFSPQQSKALDQIKDFLKSDDQVFYLAGYAGTGKTTLARHIANGANGRVLFAAYTGKAASVLQEKGCPASTLHSLLYIVENKKSKKPIFMLNTASDIRNAALVIIDECSMINKQMGIDLLSFGVKVLVLGDPAQLPPVQGVSFFLNAKPNIILTEIHRQAKDNPILYLATQAREGKKIKVGDYGDSQCIMHQDLTVDMALNSDQILVGTNSLRVGYNESVRRKLGRKDFIPEKGDRAMCLRNEYSIGILNGSIWYVLDATVEDGFVYLDLESEINKSNKLHDVMAHLDLFNPKKCDARLKNKWVAEEFTHAYAITTHKAQGSEWDSVVVVDQSKTFKEHAAKWLYTAITRASKHLILANT